MRRAIVYAVSVAGVGIAGYTSALAQSPYQIRERMEVDQSGAHVVKDVRFENGRIYKARSLDQGFVDPMEVTDPRWVEDDNGLFWICNSVSLGDNGAALMAGKGLNNEMVSLYSPTGPQPIFDFDALGSEDPVVDVSDSSPISTAYVCFDRDPGPDYDFEGIVHVFSNTGDGTPTWSYNFPLTLNYFGGGGAVSDNGKVVLAWKADPNIERLRVEAFKADGTPISSSQIYTTYNNTNYFHSRQTRLSDDGSRAYFNIGTKAVIYDVASGTVIHEEDIGGSFDSHAFSGDGKTFSFGFFGYFEVYRETSPGNWSQIARETFTGSTYVARLDLNKDGSRMGFMVQRYSPNYDHIETGLYDVDGESIMFNNAYDAPGTSYQLVCAGVKVDDLGEYVAGTSWGDSFNTTPETFVFDEDGNTTAEFDARGSGFDVDIDLHGDVVASGHKAVHANEFGNGGDVLVGDAYEEGLHLVGYPEKGGSLDMELTQPGNGVLVAATLKLSPLGNPIEVALNTRVALLGPYNVPGGGLTVPLNIPNNSFVEGKQFHFQAGTKNGSIKSNKVSIRVQP